MNRKFKQNTPAKALLTDITYLTYKNGKRAYLSTIKDSSTNEILAYNVSDSLSLKIAIDTITKLSLNKSAKLHSEALIHSDQGVHYNRYQRNLKKMTPVQYKNHLITIA